MNEKKRQIIEAAIRLFAEKGYHATSIQEITDTLGIAKGSVYFYFKSKEDLFLSVLRYYVDQLLSGLQALSRDETLTPRDRLYRQVVQHYRLHMEYRDFILTMWKERVDVNDELNQLFYYMNGQTLSLYQSSICELYPEQDVKPYSMDAVTLFLGMIGYYLQFMLHQPGPYDIPRLARSLVERLDDIVQGMIRKEQPPILDIAKMDELLLQGTMTIEPDGPDVHVELQAIRALAESNVWKPEVREEVLAALAVLEEEFAKMEPRTVVVKAMAALLKSFKLDELKPRLNKLAAYWS